MSIFWLHVKYFVLDEIQNVLYIQARLQCNFGDDRNRNKDILKTGRGLTIKLSKNVLCFMYFPRANGAERRARVLIPPGYLPPGKRKH